MWGWIWCNGVIPIWNWGGISSKWRKRLNLDWAGMGLFRKFPAHKYLLWPDDAGKEGATKLATRLGLWRCSLINLPHKDANECLLKGISKEEIQGCFNAPVDLTPEAIVSPNYFSRVESWRSSWLLYLQLPSSIPYVRVSRIRLTDYLHPGAFTFCTQGALVGTSYRPKESK